MVHNKRDIATMNLPSHGFCPNIMQVPQMRTLYDDDGKTSLAELDAVVKVKKGQHGVIYVGSAKTYCDGVYGGGENYSAWMDCIQ